MELSKITCRYERVSAIKHDIPPIGCAMSHIKCLELAKERNLPQVLIVEDDMMWVGNDIRNKIDSLRSHDFNVAVLGPLFESGATVIKVNHYFVTNTTCQTTVAYLCSDKYYDIWLEKLNESIAEMLNGGSTDIHAIDQSWKLLQKRDSGWLFAYPPICKQRPGYSNILGAHVDYGELYERKLNVLTDT